MRHVSHLGAGAGDGKGRELRRPHAVGPHRRRGQRHQPHRLHLEVHSASCFWELGSESVYPEYLDGPHHLVDRAEDYQQRLRPSVRRNADTPHRPRERAEGMQRHAVFVRHVHVTLVVPKEEETGLPAKGGVPFAGGQEGSGVRRHHGVRLRAAPREPERLAQVAGHLQSRGIPPLVKELEPAPLRLGHLECPR